MGTSTRYSGGGAAGFAAGLSAGLGGVSARAARPRSSAGSRAKASKPSCTALEMVLPGPGLAAGSLTVVVSAAGGTRGVRIHRHARQNRTPNTPPVASGAKASGAASAAAPKPPRSNINNAGRWVAFQQPAAATSKNTIVPNNRIESPWTNRNVAGAAVFNSVRQAVQPCASAERRRVR